MPGTGSLPVAALLIAAATLASASTGEHFGFVTPRPDDVLIGVTRFAFVVGEGPPAIDRIDVYVSGRLIGTAGPDDWALTWDVPEGLSEPTVVAVAYAGEEVVEQISVATRPLGMVAQEHVSLVQLFPVVTDRRGRYVHDLDRSAFSVLDQGRPVEIRHFSVEAVSSELALLIDVSKSMTDKIGTVRGACYRLLDRLENRHRLSLYAFNQSLIPFIADADDYREVQVAVRDLRTGGGTALYDALIRVLDRFHDRTGRRVVVLFSDGDDERSIASVDAVVREAQKSGVLIYAVGTVGDDDSERSRHDLAVLTEASGGQAYFIRNTRDLDRAFDGIVRDIEGQYVMSYPTPPGPPGQRSIEVRVNRNGLRVRCRPHYWVEHER